MCRPFHVVPYSDRNKSTLTGNSATMKKVVMPDGKKVLMKVQADVVECVKVIEISWAQYHQLKEGSPILVIDPEGYLRSGSVEYKPKFVGTKFLELKIRYGKSERTIVKFNEDVRDGLMLVRKV